MKISKCVRSTDTLYGEVLAGYEYLVLKTEIDIHNESDFYKEYSISYTLLNEGVYYGLLDNRFGEDKKL